MLDVFSVGFLILGVLSLGFGLSVFFDTQETTLTRWVALIGSSFAGVLALNLILVGISLSY